MTIHSTTHGRRPRGRTRTRRRALQVGAGAALAAGLVLAAPLAASAHVTVSPDAGTAGGSDVLTFAFSHGCDESPTTSLRVTIPDGLTSVSPTIEAGWSVDVERDPDDGLVSEVTFTTDEPIPSGLRAAVSLGVGYADDAAGQTLTFPVEQTCVEGATDWSEVAEEGVDPHSLDAPAPQVVVAESGDDAHGAQSSDDEMTSASDATSSTEQAEQAEQAEQTAPIGVGLGVAGLVAGLGALIVAIAAFRRAGRV